MKPIQKSLIFVLLVLLLASVLLSCTGKPSKDDDRWMNGEVDVDSSVRVARPQQFDNSGDSAYQSGNRIDLPTVPLD